MNNDKVLLRRCHPRGSFKYSNDDDDDTEEERRRLVQELAPQLPKYQTVTGLDLSQCDLSTVLNLGALESLFQLESLILDSCSIRDEHYLPRRLIALRTLRYRKLGIKI